MSTKLSIKDLDVSQLNLQIKILEIQFEKDSANITDENLDIWLGLKKEISLKNEQSKLGFLNDGYA